MNKKRKAIILGGTNAHVGLINELKKREFYTILVDYSNNTPAKNHVDKHVLLSTLDKKGVLQLAKNNEVDLVLNTNLDQPITTACYVSEKLNLGSPFSYKTAQYITDKILMKQKMMEGNIPTSKFVFVNGNNPYDISGLKFPVIVKPADATGSLGIHKSENSNNLNVLIKEALKNSKTNKAIIEEFKEGLEVNIYCFVYNEKVHMLLITEKFKTSDILALGVEKVGSIAPAALSGKTKTKIRKTAEKIVDVFKIGNTPLLIQAIISNEEINVIEIAARLGGGISFETINMHTGFDILKETVNIYTNDKINLEIKNNKTLIGTSYTYLKTGIFENIEGLDELIRNEIIDKYFVLVSKGKAITEDMPLTRRKGCSFIVSGKSRGELFEKAKIAFDKIKVFDKNGNSMKREDIYLREKKEVTTILQS